MEALGFDLRAEAILATLTEDVVKLSEIEGENLDKEQAHSSIARRLGLDIGALARVDRDVKGVVEMILDATQNYEKALAEERLFDWHGKTAGPIQVISGRMDVSGCFLKRPTRLGCPARWRLSSNGSRMKRTSIRC